ncbi:DUF5615 family PIN-like protein [Jiella sp. MQZ9-1]|uniref:DUF5615 family PIN-like protein n=1 Tax=Jiella flava TaxID=2816857 RepID=A0A939FY06_9HYPH|nr:DUF5615 family PIN-like protein [Jiella flava]MBO0663600.1 DUF5615 family PIN-like protein [Jiella flava]MCD2472175.1 DUF5615 family PIN-like protein [Jiella flava]
MDEGVPASVADAFREMGHQAILHHEVLAEGVADDIVCTAALANAAILIAQDKDMKKIVQRFGTITPDDRFARLNMVRLCCKETLAVSRVRHALGLIEYEWSVANAKAARRLWVEIGSHYIKTYR